MDLLQHAVEVGREGIEDLSAQGLGNGVDVVEELRRGALGSVVQAGQAGVEGAQLLVRLEGGFAGRVELRVGVFAALGQPTAATGARGRWYLRTSTSLSSAM